MITRLCQALLVVFFISAQALASPASPVLEIEENPVLASILAESRVLGSAPEVYVLAEKYRLDLTLIDLVDQVTLLTEEKTEISTRLKKAYLSTTGNPFLTWIDELDKIAASDPALRHKLNKKLRLQFYTPTAAAVLPEYSFIDFDKIRDNPLLARTHRYNEFAQDAEGAGLLLAFKKTLHPPFFTAPLTVTKLKDLSRKDLRRLRKAYYQILTDLYQKHDPASVFTYHSGRGKFKATRTESFLPPPYKIFNILAALPNKHEVLLFLAAEIPGIPYENGLVILTPSFITENKDAVETALRKYTQNQITQSPDDEYLLGLRRWIKENHEDILTQLTKYNSSHGTQLTLFHKNLRKLPRRAEAILDHEILLKIYKDLPWMSREHGILFDKKGRERFLSLGPNHPHCHFIKRLAHELIQTENYLSVLIGTSALILTHGNAPVAMSVQKIAKDAIEVIRYDHEWKELLKEIPSDVLTAFLVGTGLSAGRLYKILALGAGQGALQSISTGQDVKTGAAVGMLYNFLATYLIPANISQPMTRGFDAKSLAANRRLELLEGAVRGSLQGTAVSLITGEPVLGGAIKGLTYGTLSTQLLIWMMGTRYNPFKDYSDAAIDETIDLENKFQNEFGRGGIYSINRQLILDANYRVGGILQDMLGASITYPGNVAMGDQGFLRLTTLTHEASHLMQQEQSGVFGFYLFRYIPAVIHTGYNGHPDEHFLADVIGVNQTPTESKEQRRVSLRR